MRKDSGNIEDNAEAIESFKWVFKKKNMSQELFIATVGQLLELARKFMIEGNLSLVKIVFKKYFKKFIAEHTLIKQILQ